jgi:hypothetical protein
MSVESKNILKFGRDTLLSDGRPVNLITRPVDINFGVTTGNLVFWNRGDDGFNFAELGSARHPFFLVDLKATLNTDQNLVNQLLFRVQGNYRNSANSTTGQTDIVGPDLRGDLTSTGQCRNQFIGGYSFVLPFQTFQTGFDRRLSQLRINVGPTGAGCGGWTLKGSYSFLI